MRAGPWDVAAERQVEISGGDAVAFTQLLTPGLTVAVGRCRYVIFLDEDAGIVNDAVLYRLEQDRFWLSPWRRAAVGQGRARDLFHVTVHEPDASPAASGAPGSSGCLRAVWRAGTGAGLLPVPGSGTGHSAGAQSHRLERRLGYELILQDANGATSCGSCAWTPVWTCIKPACPSWRGREGLLSYCSDTLNNPFTIGMARLLDIDKPQDYIGKAAAAHPVEHARRLVGALGGAPIAPNEHFLPVTVAAETVGHITRCVYSPRRAQHRAGQCANRIEFTRHKIDLGDRRSAETCRPGFPPKRLSRPGSAGRLGAHSRVPAGSGNHHPKRLDASATRGGCRPGFW